MGATSTSRKSCYSKAVRKTRSSTPWATKPTSPNASKPSNPNLKSSQPKDTESLCPIHRGSIAMSGRGSLLALQLHAPCFLARSPSHLPELNRTLRQRSKHTIKGFLIHIAPQSACHDLDRVIWSIVVERPQILHLARHRLAVFKRPPRLIGIPISNDQRAQPHGQNIRKTDCILYFKPPPESLQNTLRHRVHRLSVLEKRLIARVCQEVIEVN